MREVELTVAPGKTGFTRLESSETGIVFDNRLSDEAATTNQILFIGGGAAAGDIDNDGLVDIFFARTEGPNALYKNLGGWKFQDVTPEALRLEEQASTGVAMVDIEGDGDLDLLISGIAHGVRLFANDGSGRFTEKTEAAGLATTMGSTSVALADIDGDRDLDLYVANYRNETLRDGGVLRLKQTILGKKIPESLKGSIRISESGAVFEIGQPDSLFLNNGDGTFESLSWIDGRFNDAKGQALSEAPPDWGLSALFRDVDLDGDPDLYVCNDFESPDRLWMNDGKGHFQEADPLAIRHTSATSMGADFADIDRDGDLDFFVVDMLSRDHQLRKQQMGTMTPTPITLGKIDDQPQLMRNTLFVNRGDSTYAEIADLAGIFASEWSWAPVFLDVDLDGFQDLIITNGYLRDVQDIDIQNKVDALPRDTKKEHRRSMLLFPPLARKNLAFKSSGALTFEETAEQWGVADNGVSQGMAMADLDNDGDLDFVTNNSSGQAGVYRNNTSAPRVSVRLEGEGPNTNGIGARVTLRGGSVEQTNEMVEGGPYLSDSDAMLVFATGETTSDLALDVVWPSGKRSHLDLVKPNVSYRINESFATSPKPAAVPKLSPTFVDQSDTLSHSHHENPYDDFRRQSLLPNRLSQLGPGVVWYDFDLDGRDDLLLGDAPGGDFAIHFNKGSDKFETLHLNNLGLDHDIETSGLAAWRDSPTTVSILVGLSNFDSGSKEQASAAILRLQNGKVIGTTYLSGGSSTTGPVAVADVDGDGDLDLFLGGRTIPGRYPEPATSRLFLNQNGSYKQVPQRLFERIGLVSGATFADLDGNGFPDLVLALEWGPVRVFLNTKGNFREATQQLGFDKFVGWWNGVTTGDLDGDGKLDILATNWGKNHKYHAIEHKPANALLRRFRQTTGSSTSWKLTMTI